ncbi:MAG: hypothetical protein JSV89_12060 [Spirochaetaceae bacterium]|nr:MAG: hypothetical protein JSV89_12060 [Spirochaetaceae bacterium]
MRRRPIVAPVVFVLAALLAGLSGCGRDEIRGVVENTAPDLPAAAVPASELPPDETSGSIIFTANGEDFVRHGFVDKQGWRISFEKLYVNILSPIAYVPDKDRQVVLEGAHWVDLAEGGGEADPVFIGSAEGVPPANYQSLRFALRRASDGPYAGSSIVMIGSADREGLHVPFTIRLDEEMIFDGREGYVGEELKGLLKSGSTTEVEMTFHFDHVFGDSGAGEDDHINTGSVGFDFFYAYVSGGVVDVSQAELKDTEDYSALVQALWTLGHLGEGHCEVSQQSSREFLQNGS